jgi:hypothetical protein
MGEPSLFLGLQIFRTEAGIVLHQGSYVSKLITQFGVEHLPPKCTPMETRLDFEESDIITEKPYRSLIGALLFLAVSTRPDIAYATSRLSQYLVSPSEFHYLAAIRILRYLKLNQRFGIHLNKGGMKNACVQIKAYVDADWANDSDRRSYGAYLIFVNKSLVSWNSKKMKGSIPLSSTEAEYYALTEAIKEIMWIMRLLKDFGHNAEVTVFEDNTSTISMIENNSSKGKTKHSDIRLKFLQDLMEKGTFKIEYIKSRENIADGLTKALPAPRLREIVQVLMKDTGK